MKGITLIGMPGAGKSTIGKKLADSLGWKFLDLDILIQEKTGLAPAEFIGKNGDTAFLELEEELSLDLNLAETVFAPGGSIIYSTRAMNKLKSETQIFYLDLPLEEVKKRLGPKPLERGIIGLARWGLEGLFTERHYLYQTYAHQTISFSDAGDQDVIEQIKKIVFLA
ncbi:MAG: shikimate kinase [bacterium]|nr:shikimate kinase [bacterium]